MLRQSKMLLKKEKMYPYQFPYCVTLQSKGNSWLDTLSLRRTDDGNVYDIKHRFTVCRNSANPLIHQVYISPQLPVTGIVYVPARDLRVEHMTIKGKVFEHLEIPVRYRHLTSSIQQVVAFSVKFLPKAQLFIEFETVYTL